MRRMSKDELKHLLEEIEQEMNAIKIDCEAEFMTKEAYKSEINRLRREKKEVLLALREKRGY